VCTDGEILHGMSESLLRRREVINQSILFLVYTSNPFSCEFLQLVASLYKSPTL
jgi:hypothetical protein